VKLPASARRSSRGFSQPLLEKGIASDEITNVPEVLCPGLDARSANSYRGLQVMQLHQLVIFWRDKQARYFTCWHFLPSKSETAHQRALLMLKAISKLSRLQIYGAVLDNEAIALERIKPAPPEAIPTMMEISLRPAKRMSPTNRPITITIPGANSQLCAEVEDGIFSSRLWSIIKKQIIPYLCSPEGVKVSDAANAIIGAANILLYYHHRPQPGISPLISAISEAEQKIESAELIYKSHPTKENLHHKDQCLHHLEQLKKWQQLEVSAFSVLEESKLAVKKRNTTKLELLRSPKG
jgi:hypothetical protein